MPVNEHIDLQASKIFNIHFCQICFWLDLEDKVETK